LKTKNNYSSWDRRSQCSGSHRYSSYSTYTLGSGRDSPPEIVQYSRPPENLTSPNRESNSALPQPELVTRSPHGKEPTTRESLQAAFNQERNNFNQNHQNRKSPSKRSGSGSDLFSQHSSGKKSSGSRSGHGPLSILRRSFRRSTSKKHSITAYQVNKLSCFIIQWGSD
jgi:hypothetical protein